MKPIVRYSRKWWRVYVPGSPDNVGVYGTWERAMDYANQIARKGKES